MFGRKKKDKPKPTTLLGKFWYFIWEDNSVLSWVVNIILAFVLIKFMVYPALGFLLGTTHPVVAVVSNSMQHNSSIGDSAVAQMLEHNSTFDKWWYKSGQFYEDNYGITKDIFRKFSMSTGFSKGDIIVLRRGEPQSLKAGDIIVFSGSEPDPIIHRVVEVWEEDGQFYFRTKGDNNEGFVPDEIRISQSRIIGKAWFKLPLLGYVKIIFTDLVRLMGVG